MSRLEETHGIKFELVRHFLARMFESEIFAVRGQWQNVALSAVAAMLPIGLLFGSYTQKYHWLSALPSPIPFRNAAFVDELSVLVLVMAVSGLVALVQWDSLYPGKRDYLALAGLPIRSRQIFVSRLTAVGLFTTAFVLLLNLLPSIIIALQIAGRWQKNPSLMVNVAAQTIAASLACYFVFLAAMALQGALLHLLTPKLFARVSAYVQGLAIAVCFLAVLFSWSIGDWGASAIGRVRQFGGWAPPVWFLGLHEKLLGDHDAFFVTMSRHALQATAVALALTVLAYFLGYRRYRKLLIEGVADVPVPRRSHGSLLRWIAGDPRREAIMQFLTKTLARSRAHRTVFLAYVGAGVAFAVNSVLLMRATSLFAESWYAALQFVVLFWPVALSATILPGFRHVCSLPAELPANWMFQTTESLGRKQWMSALERFAVICVIGPIYLVITPIAVSVLGWGLALRMTALQVLISLTIFEVLFYSWQQLPFACSYVPGKRPVVAIIARATAMLGIAVPLLTIVVRTGSTSAATFAVFLPIMLFAWIWARRRRREGWGEAKLAYEDRLSAIPNLGLGELTYRADPVQPAEPAAIVCEPQGVQEPPRPPRPVATSLRIYRALACAFPHEFKCAYGDELLQATEDAIEPIWRRHGELGLVRLLADIAWRVPAEHAAQFWRDLRYSMRTLASSSGFTAVAVTSLALAICIATCAFSVMNGMVLRVLPQVSEPDELVGLQAPVSYPDYKRYKQSEAFSSAMAYVAPVPLGISLEGRTERVWGHLVAPSYLSTLGVAPLLGRAFGAEQEQPGASPVVVISYRFWQGYLGGDEDVIGRTLRINGHAVTIIGVGPKDFLGASPALFASDIWMPLSAGEQIAPELADRALERRDRNLFHVVGRLRPGVTLAAAEARLDAIARQIERDRGQPVSPDQTRRITLVTAGKLLPLRRQDRPFFTSFFLMLAGLVVLIACANVSTMMLARAARRRREIAVRLALGASRGRLIVQLLTESMLIATAAGALGFLLSTWLMHLFSQARVMPLPIPVTYNFSVDARVFAFTLAVTTLTGLLFGLAPAWHATRLSLVSALKEGGNIQLLRFRRLSLRNLLMVAQVAASLTLLVVVGLMSVGIQSTLGIQEGFNPKNLYLLAVDPVRDGLPVQQAQAFSPKMLERVRALPGITSACLTDTVPVAMNLAPWVRLSRAGSSGGETRVHWAVKQVVGSGYFETADVPILQGRSFNRQDEVDTPSTVIVSATLVREFLGGTNPVGQRLEIQSGENMPPSGGSPGDPDFRRGVLGNGLRTFVIVGVAGDVTNSLVKQREHPAIYLPLRPADYAQPSLQGTTLMVRAAPGMDALRAVQDEISALDSRITPFDARSMRQQIQQFMGVLRSATWTYAVIGLFGLVLAAVGLAGVTAYSVSQRNHEIGVRVALGARANNVLTLVMKEGATLVAVGTGLGMLGAFAASRLLAFMNASVATVTSTSTSNPVLLVGAPLLLAGIALLACYVPARRSLQVEPLIALRQE